MVWVLKPGHNATHSLQIEACLRTNSRPRSLSLLIGSRHYESYSHSDVPAEIHTDDQLVPSLPLCVCVCSPAIASGKGDNAEVRTYKYRLLIMS